MNRTISALVGASLLASIAGFTTGAFGADMAYKAPKSPPPPQPEPLDIHGFFDLSFKNAYITPRGLLVTNTGLTTQALMGLTFDIYKGGTGFINGTSVFMGVWNDLWSKQDHPKVGSWNEFDWFVGGEVVFAQNWKAVVTYIEFLSPPGNFSAERNLEFGLFYNDAGWGLPIAFKPYVKLFYEASGPSTVVTGKNADTYDVEIGMVPTMSLKPYGANVTLTAPTWITVGPSSYWNRGVSGCGPSVFTPCDSSNTGVFSTGLTAKMPLDFLIPTRLGNWYISGGFQYYYLFNDSLLLAQTFTGTATSFNSAHRDVTVGFAGIGFTF
jgi:hypothetical protein